MHKEFLRLLETATGRSEYVVAINLDIRGFTRFSQFVESLPIATYIKKVYLKIIKEYFKNASYYKPTGDGLIIIIPYTEQTLKDVSNSTIESCLKLLGSFASLLAYDPMINYPTPQEIGIGLTRGCACCITSKDDSGERTLDYSGRILNLASRLMDLARPSGIIFDDSFGINLLKEETKGLFSEDTVYVRGVAEEKPIRIFYTKKNTLIPDAYHNPLKEPKWNTETYEYTFGKLKKLVGTLTLELSQKPLDEKKITVEITYPNPKVNGFLLVHEYTVDKDELSYKRKGSTHCAILDINAVNKKLEKEGVAEEIGIKIDVTYPIK